MSEYERNETHEQTHEHGVHLFDHNKKIKDIIGIRNISTRHGYLDTLQQTTNRKKTH